MAVAQLSTYEQLTTMEKGLLELGQALKARTQRIEKETEQIHSVLVEMLAEFRKWNNNNLTNEDVQKNR